METKVRKLGNVIAKIKVSSDDAKFIIPAINSMIKFFNSNKIKSLDSESLDVTKQQIELRREYLNKNRIDEDFMERTAEVAFGFMVCFASSILLVNKFALIASGALCSYSVLSYMNAYIKEINAFREEKILRIAYSIVDGISNLTEKIEITDLVAYRNEISNNGMRLALSPADGRGGSFCGL